MKFAISLPPHRGILPETRRSSSGGIKPQRKTKTIKNAKVWGGLFSITKITDVKWVRETGKYYIKDEVTGENREVIQLNLYEYAEIGSPMHAIKLQKEAARKARVATAAVAS